MLLLPPADLLVMPSAMSCCTERSVSRNLQCNLGLIYWRCNTLSTVVGLKVYSTACHIGRYVKWCMPLFSRSVKFIVDLEQAFEPYDGCVVLQRLHTVQHGSELYIFSPGCLNVPPRAQIRHVSLSTVQSREQSRRLRKVEPVLLKVTALSKGKLQRRILEANLRAMENHFERLPESCLGMILNRVYWGSPEDHYRSIRPVCRSFLEHVRATASQLTLVDPHACSDMLAGGFSFLAHYVRLKSLQIDTRCLKLAETVGLGAICWERVSITQADEREEDGIGRGVFLLDGSKQSLRQLAFAVGSDTCNVGVAEWAWHHFESYLQKLEPGPRFRLVVRNVPLVLSELDGGDMVRLLELDLTCERFTVATPHVFKNLESLTIYDKDAPGEKEEPEGFWAEILEEFGSPPWPKMENLKDLNILASHHQWSEDSTLAEETFRCIASQAPNLESVILLGMVFAEVVGPVLESLVGSLCSLKKLECLILYLEGGDHLDNSELSKLVPLVRKTSLKKLVINGLSASQAELVKKAARKGLRFETPI